MQSTNNTQINHASVPYVANDTPTGVIDVHNHLKINELPPKKRVYTVEKLSKFDKSVIDYFKTHILNDEGELAVFLYDLEKLHGDFTPKMFLKSTNSDHGLMTEKGRIELVKRLARKRPTQISSLIKKFKIKDQNALIEIACICNDPKNIKRFGIKSQTGLVKVAKRCARKDAKRLIDNLDKFKIDDMADLGEIFSRCAKTRPDLVLENLQKLDTQNAENLKAKCQTYSVPGNAAIIHGEVKAVFDLFEEIAANPAVEIIGRKMWSKYGDRHLDGALKLNDSEVTRCGVTNKALLSAIFGIGKRKTNNLKLKHKKLDPVCSIIQGNFDQLKGMPPSHFFAYSLSSTTLDHVFIVIQFKDEEEQIRYRFLQSWVNKYDLNRCMRERNHTLTHEEFMQFLEGFQSCLLDDMWTVEKGMFCNKYFMSEPSYALDSRHQMKSNLSVEWGASNLDEVMAQKDRFESFKQARIFPLKTI